MRLLLILQLLFWSVPLGDRAVAQQYYSFEEACRRAGNTTGACAPKSQQKNAPKCVRLHGNAFHAEKCSGDCIEATVSPVFDSEIFVEMIGLPNVAKVNELKLTIWRSTPSANCKNAVAVFVDGSRSIVYDAAWAKAATAESYLILGHEAGHHFCGHTLGDVEISPHERELEADRFSGASIKRFETYHGKAFIREALAVAAKLYSLSGSRSHPPRAARVEAISLGYNSGSPCGNLAPGIRGYTSGPR